MTDPTKHHAFYPFPGRPGCATCGKGYADPIHDGFRVTRDEALGVTINPNEGRPAEVDASGWQPGIKCEHGYDACPICDKQHQRSLDDIWNAILDVKQELKAINARGAKADAARENDRLRTHLVEEARMRTTRNLVNEGKVK